MYFVKTIKPLVIAFDAQPLFQNAKSGVGYYSTGLISALAKAYPDEIKLIGYHFGRTSKSIVLPSEKNIEYRRCWFMNVRLLNTLRRLRLDPPLELFIRDPVDFALYPNYHGLRSLRDTPSACVVHDLAYVDKPETLTRKNQQDLKNLLVKTLTRSSFVISVSAFTAQRLRSYYAGMRDKKIVVSRIPPQDAVAQPSSVPELRNKKYVLFMGTLEPRKNIQMLINTYKRLDDSLRNTFELVLAGGPGWKSESIIEAINAAQDQGYAVRYLGYVTDSEKEYLYSHATLLIQPSLYEGFGMPILEAMQRKLPVIASDLEVFREVAGDGAHYFDPLDIASLSKGITELLSNPEARSKYSEKGRKVAGSYSWQKAAKLVYTAIKDSVDLKR